jgi:hypothetical protein
MYLNDMAYVLAIGGWGALHRTNERNTLDDDAPQSPCHLER